MVFSCLFFLAGGGVFLHALDPGKAISQYYYENYTKKDGLPHNRIICFAQDETGFLYLGTELGLARFDGKNFKVYDGSNTPGMACSRIFALCFDPGGNLWMGTSNGLFRFRDEVADAAYTTRDGLLNNVIACLRTDNRGRLWIGSYGGLNVIEDGRITAAFTMEHGLPHNSVRVIEQDEDGTMWIGSRNGLCTIREGKVSPFFLGAPGEKYNIRSILTPPGGGLWFVTRVHGLFQWKKGRLIALDSPGKLPPHPMHAARLDKDGNIWFPTWGHGIFRRTPEGTYSSFTRARGLAENKLDGVFADRGGNLWVGTYTRGLCRFSDVLFTSYSPAEGLPESAVWSVLEARDGAVWFGTDGGGLSRFRDGKFTTFTTRDNLKSMVISSLWEDPDGTLWCGTAMGLNRIKDGGVFDPAPGDHIDVYAIYRDRKERLLVGTFAGVKELRGKRLVPFEPLKKFSTANVRAIREDRRGNIWVGTFGGGAFVISENPPAVTRYTTRNGLRSDVITYLYEDKRGVMWMGSFGGGAGMYRVKYGKITPYSTECGLFSNDVGQFLEDERGNFWISTQKGLITIPYRQLEAYASGRIDRVHYTLYGRGDGLKDEEDSGGRQPGGWKNRDGSIWFPMNYGALLVDPAKVKPADNSIKLLIESIHDGVQNHVPGEKMIVPPGRKRLHFNYTALTFYKANRIAFKYKLEGFDRDWVEAGARRRAYYTNVPPGRYRFKLSARRGARGLTSEISLPVVIKPHVYQTWQFRGLGLLLLVLLVYSGLRRRVARMRKQQKKLETLVAQRTAQLDKKNDNLEKINRIVTLISRETDFTHLLEAVMKEVFSLGAVEKAGALVYDSASGRYNHITSVGWEDDGGFENISFTAQEAEERYIAGAVEVTDNVYVVNQAQGRPHQDKVPPAGPLESWLVLKTQVGPKPVGFLIFDNMKGAGELENLDMELLSYLKKHIDMAFIKSTLLHDLQSANKELEVARVKAEEGNRAKSEFLARMSHEIRTPLNSIIGFTEMLADTESPEIQRDFLRAVEHSSETLLALVNDILDFSKIEAGHLTFESIDFDPELTVYNTCESLMPRLDRKPVDLVCHVGDSVPAWVLGDPVRFRQVVGNLLSNACKFTEKGEIAVTLEMEQEIANELFFHVKVRDTGSGIPKDKLDIVFDAFLQADGSTTRKYGGTGLGLAISRQIARLMGGDVWAESEVGKGSTFHFTGRLKKSAAGPSKRLRLTNLSGRRLLVVDDNADNLELLAHVLKFEGIRVTTLEEPAEAVPELLRAGEAGEPYELCILDVLMPVITGYDLARSILKADTIDPKPVLMAYSSAYGKHAANCTDAGFDGFLPKPVHRNKLLKMIQRLLDKRKTGIRKQQAMEEQKDAEPAAPVPVPAKAKPLVTQHTLQEDDKHSIRILLVEDNPMNQKLAVYLLNRGGYRVEVANHGGEAVEKFSAAPDNFDLVFMDVQMAEMDGLEATRRLRKLGFEKIPIIAMTAGSMSGDREKCLEAGMNDYIAKPIKREVVYEMIKKWCLTPADQ